MGETCGYFLLDWEPKCDHWDHSYSPLFHSHMSEYGADQVQGHVK